jgi:hypothetical protein
MLDVFGTSSPWGIGAITHIFSPLGGCSPQGDEHLYQAPDEFLQVLEAPGVSGHHMLHASGKPAQFDIRLCRELDYKGALDG